MSFAQGTMVRFLAVTCVITLSVGLASGCTDDDTPAPADPADSTTTETTSSTEPSTTEPATTDTPTTTEPAAATIQLFFLDEDAFAVGRLPYLRPVEREADPDGAELLSLELLFEGPTDAETASGLRFVPSEATGVSTFEIIDGTAHVRLEGGCSSGGSTFTVADHIVSTLVQFTSVDAVKIYDPDGQTGSPDDPGDSIPFCLEP